MFEFFDEMPDIPEESFEIPELEEFCDELKAENQEEEYEYPPYFGKLGESVEHRAKRHELESNLRNGYEIAAENSYKELIEIEKKEAAR